jgi:hypothetical protein
MAFDMKKLDTASFKRRVKEIPVENEVLKKFFTQNGSTQPKDKKKSKTAKEVEPVIVVQNLTALEMAIAKDEVDNSRSREQIITALFGSLPGSNVEAIKELAGVIQYDAQGDPETLPADYVRRLFYILHGCVDPNFEDQQQVIKFARAFPVEFFGISNEIIRLSGLGMELGE